MLRTFAKYLVIVFFLVLGLQLVLLGLCTVIRGMGDLLLTTVYWPWIELAVNLSGAEGEATMIWPPVYGIIMGILFYSLFGAILFSSIKVLRQKPEQ